MALQSIVLAGVCLCASLAIPSTALAQQDRVSASEKGSLLVFTKVELRWENVEPYNLIQDTFIHLTNDYPAAVDVKMYFVNGDAPIFDDREHPGWNWLDNAITLTANEPAYWSAATGLPKGVSPFRVLDPGPPPGRVDPNNPDERHLRGFILAWAIDSIDGDEIRWNHLAGDASIVNYAGEYAWQYNAWAFQVVNGTPHGQQPGTPGHLALDDSEYSSCFAELLMNFVATDSDAYSGDGGDITHDTDLTLVPGYWDVRQETVGPRIVKASFDIWNENEVKFTNLDRCVNCWDQELLSRHAIPNHFLVGALGTDAGKARIEGLESVLCPDSQKTSLLGVAAKHLDFAAGAAAAAGNNLVGLGFEPAEIWYDEQGPPPESRWDPTTLLVDELLKSLK